jgi:hypothetical protein
MRRRKMMYVSLENNALIMFSDCGAIICNFSSIFLGENILEKPML